VRACVRDADFMAGLRAEGRRLGGCARGWRNAAAQEPHERKGTPANGRVNKILIAWGSRRLREGWDRVSGSARSPFSHDHSTPTDCERERQWLTQLEETFDKLKRAQESLRVAPA
jgi:hypothetical protein